jgi:hypothetical protein
MSHIIHPDEMQRLEPETHEPQLEPQDEEVGGNPGRLKCPKCGDVPLHYELHVKSCKGKRTGI